MKRKWFPRFAALMVMMVFLMGCGGTADSAGASAQADSEGVQDVSETSGAEATEGQGTVSTTEIEPEERELLYRVLFHHPDDTDPEDDEVVYKYEYDEVGRLLREWDYIHKSYAEYEYNASGGLMKCTRYFKDDLTGWSEYAYDALGYLVRENNYGPDGNITVCTEQENDSSGNVLREVRYHGDGSMIYGTEYAYDTSGNLLEEIHYDNDGSVFLRVEYVYDESGRLAEKTDYKDADPDGNYEQRYEYAYDAAGNRIREVFYLNGEFRRYINYVFGSDGNMSRKEIHDIFSLTGEDILALYYEYTYNESGDLLTVVIYDRDGNVFYDTVDEDCLSCLLYEYRAALPGS